MALTRRASSRSASGSAEQALRELPSEGPAATFRAFQEALRDGNPRVAAACFSRQGCIQTPDATLIQGREGVREVLTQLTDLPVAVEAELTSVMAGGDVAIGRGTWILRFRDMEAIASMTHRD